MIQLQPVYFGLFLIILLFSKDFDGATGGQPPPCYKPYDVTLLDCKNGSDVVDAVFAKLDCLQVFNGSDHILMRRIACEETEYGESENYTCDESGGGIWRLERELFDKLIEPHVQNMLHNVSDIIKNRCGFSFSKAKQYTFLTKPFYSGLAARLYLHYLEITGVSVPFNGSIEEQADFWINNYHLDRTTEETTADCFNRGRASKLGNIFYCVGACRTLEPVKLCMRFDMWCIAGWVYVGHVTCYATIIYHIIGKFDFMFIQLVMIL